MKFFTDRTVVNPYLMEKIDRYLKIKSFDRWLEVFIDPGVYDLVKGVNFKWEGKINIVDFLNILPKNHFFSCDWPNDLNLDYQKLLLEKSWKTAQQYCYHPQFIVTVQFLYSNYFNFVKMFEKYNDLENISRIIGIGNMCRNLYLNEFMKHALDYAFSHCKHKRIHIYGLGLRIIPYANRLAKRFKIELSTDSTKWTRPCTTELRKLCGQWFKHEYRQNCFDAYLEKISKRIEVD